MLKCPKCKKEFKKYKSSRKREEAKVTCPNCKVVSIPTSSSYAVFSMMAIATFVIMLFMMSSLVMSGGIVASLFETEIGTVIFAIPFIFIYAMISGEIFINCIELEEYKKN